VVFPARPDLGGVQNRVFPARPNLGSQNRGFQRVPNELFIKVQVLGGGGCAHCIPARPNLGCIPARPELGVYSSASQLGVISSASQLGVPNECMYVLCGIV